MPAQSVIFKDLGLIDYQQGWNYQEELMQQLISIKLKNRDLDDSEKLRQLHYLLFCEHPHVYTLGKSGHENNLLINESELKHAEAVFYKINRGGDITYHGPGQLVGYPILDLDYFFNDVHQYMRYLEEVIIKTLAHFNIKGERIEGLTGVWLDAGTIHARKICAMGVRLSRWVTMHGFAFNVNANLSYFNNIVPCGITDKKVTSLDKELGIKPNMDEVKSLVRKYFSEVFECDLT